MRNTDGAIVALKCLNTVILEHLDKTNAEIQDEISKVYSEGKETREEQFFR